MPPAADTMRLAIWISDISMLKNSTPCP
jgi:hypothetical protein